ncbi:MAG: hypothetical protein PUC31_01425 [Bacteroidales bacterium]|nr:hypothetical protein [Bacteroidales bacterium]
MIFIRIGQECHHSCYVLELKMDDTVDNALAQIDSKGNAIPLSETAGKFPSAV